MYMNFYEAAPLSDATRALLMDVSTATLTTVLYKTHGLKSVFMIGPKPLDPGLPRMVGPAYTVRLIPAREDITTPALSSRPGNPQRTSIEETPAGHVLCFATGGEVRSATLGDILAERLRVRGVAGFCTDGGVRDATSVAKLGLPVFCNAPSAPASWAHLMPCEGQVPVACGDVTVLPGDILVGDGDGVVVIPANIVDAVAEEAADQEDKETFIFERVSAGTPTPGTYPPNEETLAAYQAWRKEKGR